MPRVTQQQRRDATAASRAQPVADSYILPSPVGGLNAKDALAAMPETDAVQLDNMFPQPSWVEVRGGRSTVATFSGTGVTLMAYNGILTAVNQLFCAVSNGSIYQVDNRGGGAVGSAVVSGLASAVIDYQQFGTGGGEYLIGCTNSGTDAPFIYDGTTWQRVTTSSTPFAWTGGPALSTLNQVAVYKSRLWFVQANTMNVYYLPQNVVGGTLTQLNLGPLFNLGGYIVTMITVSIDNSAGTNDYIAFCSNQGEIVMFQGYDPSNVATWSEAAHFRVGPPIGYGRATWQKLGMDAAIICQDGYVLMSEALLTDRSQQKDTLSDKVRYAINQAIGLYGTNNGWQTLLHPAGNKLLLNVPTKNDYSSSYQFVMNTLTGAWCTWGLVSSPLNAVSMTTFNNNLYMSYTGGVDQIDTGTSDNGAPITWIGQQAFSYMGSPAKTKRFTMCKPTFQASAGLSVSAQMLFDFQNYVPIKGTLPLTNGGSAFWNVTKWNSNAPWGDNQQVISKWIGLEGDGNSGSMVFAASTNNLTAKWMSTLILFETGGTFYGK